MSIVNYYIHFVNFVKLTFIGFKLEIIFSDEPMMIVKLNRTFQEGIDEVTHVPVTPTIIQKLVNLNTGMYITDKLEKLLVTYKLMLTVRN